MKVIGAGLPRTATLTQKMALELLGFGPCYHMVNVLADLDQATLWQQALAGEPQWDQIFDGMESTVDWPGGYFCKQLADFYPEAKVLLSVRDPEPWAQSIRDTVWGVRHGESLMRLLSSAQAHVNPDWAAFLQMLDALLWKGDGTFAAGHATTEDLSEGMLRHNAEVTASIPADRLLVWSVTDGWEPLCEFLEVPVPEIAMPHLNDQTEFRNRIIDSSLEKLTAWRAEQAIVATPARGVDA
jgi:hypothetical protein